MIQRGQINSKKIYLDMQQDHVSKLNLKLWFVQFLWSGSRGALFWWYKHTSRGSSCIEVHNAEEYKILSRVAIEEDRGFTVDIHSNFISNVS